MRILLTGGAGFIGSHVVDALISRDEEVIVIDNLSTGLPENINPKSQFYKLDINSGILEEVFKGKIDAVIHLAAQVSVPKSIQNPLQDALTNIYGSLNLIHLSQKYGAKKFIYINSAAIFGQPRKLPLDEDHLIQPISNYGISKNVAEQYLKVSGLNFVSLRLANVYGPRQIAEGEGGVVPIFIDKILKNQPVEIHGDGEQTRDFIFVKDVAKAIVCAIENGQGSINIGSGQATTINQLWQLLQEIWGKQIKINYTPEREKDIRYSIFAIEKAQKELGWKAETSLLTGLNETVKHEQEKLKK